MLVVVWILCMCSRLLSSRKHSIVTHYTWIVYSSLPHRVSLTFIFKLLFPSFEQYICPFTLIIVVLISFPVYVGHEFVFLYWLTIWFSHLRYHLYFMQHIFFTNKLKCYKFTINNQNRKLLPNCNWLSTHQQCYQLTPHNQNTTLLPIYYHNPKHVTMSPSTLNTTNIYYHLSTMQTYRVSMEVRVVLLVFFIWIVNTWTSGIVPLLY
jgi:hypothetical protein